MTKESDRQRLNVAASRAQDQLWCARSVSLEELHPDGVRSQLIRYCQNPERGAGRRDVFRHITGRGYRVPCEADIRCEDRPPPAIRRESESESARG